MQHTEAAVFVRQDSGRFNRTEGAEDTQNGGRSRR
jgi:hypothetical protein